jgi:hypothetical protein
MSSVGQFAALVVVVIGFLLFWGNPKRKVNRAVFASSITVAGWLVCHHLAVTQPEHGLFWLRWTSASGGLAPFTLWLVKESILGTFRFRDMTWIQRNSFWFVSAAALFVVPFTEFFIPSYSTAENRVFGPGYWLLYFGQIALYGRLLWDSLRLLQSLSGTRKLEIQIWLCGACVVGTSVFILIGLEKITHDSVYTQLKPLVVLVFYAATAYAITSYRVFDARQIMLVGIEKIVLILFATAIAYAVNYIFGLIMSESTTLLVTTASVIAAAGWLNSWLDRKFHFMPKAVEARQAAFAIAQRETRLENLANRANYNSCRY